MTASEFLTPSAKAAFFMLVALTRDKHPVKNTSRLVKGSTDRGIKDYHLHRIYSDVSADIMRNYFEDCSDKFPATFTDARGIIQACEEEKPISLPEPK